VVLTAVMVVAGLLAIVGPALQRDLVLVLAVGAADLCILPMME